MGDSIAKDLGLIIEKFKNILTEHGADHDGDFKSQEDIERCIEKLEPYEIMEKLCK